jgi:hypothetical protein
LDNALLKVQNRTLVDRNSKWKEWWQIVQEFVKEQIQESLEIIHASEEAYLNELVAYWLHFESYKYDQLISKLVEVLVNVFQNVNSPMQETVVVISFWNGLVVSTTKELEPIKGGTWLAIVSCTLPLPTEHVEILVVIVIIQVKTLEKLVTPKLIPLIILEIKVGVEVTLIDSITHTSKFFRILDIILKDTPITKRS